MVSLSENCDESEEGRARRLAQNRSKDRDTVQTQLPPCEVRCELDEYEGEEQQLAEKAHGCLEKRPHP